MLDEVLWGLIQNYEQDLSEITTTVLQGNVKYCAFKTEQALELAALIQAFKRSCSALFINFLLD